MNKGIDENDSRIKRMSSSYLCNVCISLICNLYITFHPGENAESFSDSGSHPMHYLPRTVMANQGCILPPA